MKVVWICDVSNEEIRSHIQLGFPYWRRIIRKLLGKNIEIQVEDYAHWNSNALKEFERIEDVVLHVVLVHSGTIKRVQEFELNGISYHVVSRGDTALGNIIRSRLLKSEHDYSKTHIRIKRIVKKINPDIVHIMGAENPPYSLSALLLPKKYPILVQLQTLLCEPSLIHFYPNLKVQMECERNVLLRADYIGTSSKQFPQLIRQHIREDAVVVNSHLLIGEKGNIETCEKEYDFVYFANYVNKAVDLAIEAFGIAHKINPELTLDVVGSVYEDEQRLLEERLDVLGCKASVTIEGKLPTHDDVIQQIRKARFALLPLKTDLVSSTIREAMWNGIPVLTTITSGTPSLNEKRESVLLSAIGDHDSLAANMLRIADNTLLADKLRENAAITVEEKYGGNTEKAKEWVDIYRACIANYNGNHPIPKKLVNMN